MARFKRDKQKEVPGINMNSMSDIIFMFLFFFMVITNMRETNIRVHVDPPYASEVQKLEKKSLIATLYVGTPIHADESTFSPDAVAVQLNDQTIRQEDLSTDIKNWVRQEKESRSVADREKLIFSLKADKDVQMGYINMIKDELRANDALKINYATSKIREK